MYIDSRVESYNLYAVHGLLARDVLHIDVAHRGRIVAAAHLVRLVVQVNLQDRLLALAHLDVAGVDVLNDAASAGVRLDAYHALQLGRVHHVVVGKDVAAATADLRADDHAAVAVVHDAVADDDVLRGFAPEASVVIAAALDGDAVVARVEEAVLNEHAVAALRVAAVAVGAVVGNLDATHRDVLAEQGVNDPEGRTQERHVLNENVVTLVQVDELRAQAVVLVETALVHVDTVLSSLQQTGTRTAALVNHAGLVAKGVLAAHGPPRLVRAAAVDGALARDGYVLLLVSIDAGTQVPAVDALPAGRHDGVEVGLEDKLQHGILLHNEVNVRKKGDSPRVKRSCRHDDATTALLGAGSNGLVNGFLVFHCGGLDAGSVLGNNKIAVGKLGCLNALFNLLIGGIPRIVGKGEGWNQQAEEQ